MENNNLIETEQAHAAGKGNPVFSENGRIDTFRHVEFFGPRQFFDFITVEEDDGQEPTQRSTDDWCTQDSSIDRDPDNPDEQQARKEGKKYKRSRPMQYRSRQRTKGDRLRGGAKGEAEENFYERVMATMEEAG